MNPDTLRRLQYLNINIDLEKRERYLLDRGAIVRRREHFTQSPPEGLVTFDIETDWIPAGLLETVKRTEDDPKWGPVFDEVLVRHIAKELPIQTIGVREGVVTIHHDCTKFTGVAVDESLKALEPAEVILGYNVLNFDLWLLSRYTDITRLVMKTVDLHEEARALFSELVKFGGNPKGLISLPRLARDNLDVRVEKPKVGKKVRLEEAMRKCQQDILITMELYRMYLEGSLCVEEKWRKHTVRELIGEQGA